MGRLYGSLFVLVLFFSAAMSFVTLGVHASQWWWSVIGVGILLVFAVLGGLLVPASRRAVAAADEKTAAALLQAFGALCVTEFLTMGLITWAIGNRSLSGNNAYQVLGLLIFLGLLGLGAQGVVATVSRFVYIRNRTIVEGRDATPTVHSP